MAGYSSDALAMRGISPWRIAWQCMAWMIDLVAASTCSPTEMAAAVILLLLSGNMSESVVACSKDHLLQDAAEFPLCNCQSYHE